MKVNLPVHKGEVLDVTIMDLTYQAWVLPKSITTQSLSKMRYRKKKSRLRSRRQRRTLRLATLKNQSSESTPGQSKRSRLSANGDCPTATLGIQRAVEVQAAPSG